MSAIQLRLPTIEFRDVDLTPFDRDLRDTLRAEADPRTGLVQSLFRVTSRHGLSYWYSLDRLDWLNHLGYVRVERAGQGKPLTIWIVN